MREYLFLLAPVLVGISAYGFLFAEVTLPFWAVWIIFGLLATVAILIPVRNAKRRPDRR